MSGYWNDPEATAEALVDGWLRTGDLARVDSAGCCRLAGRVKEMFIRGGYNVYPMEVESVLGNHPAIAEIAVVGRPDEVMGEIGVAVVVVSDSHEPPTLEDLRDFGSVELASYKLLKTSGSSLNCLETPVTKSTAEHSPNSNEGLTTSATEATGDSGSTANGYRRGR